MSNLDEAQFDASFFAAIFEQVPVPISVYDRHGTQVAQNAATARLWNIRREDWVGRFNMITDPQLAALGSAELHQRVMAGETVVLPPAPFSGQATGLQKDATSHVWVEATYSPLRNASGEVTHLVAILRDVSAEIQQGQAVTAAQEEIAIQRAMIETLSNPVITIWPGILTLPLVGAVDSRRAALVTENVLHAIAEQQAQCLILDITGVPIVDTQVAQHLIQTAYACRLLGCEVVLVGIGVEIAQTLIQLGVDLSALVTLADLQAGIMWAFARLKLRVVPTDGVPARR